ncbi:DUF4309 domain-containing protein [Desulforamulus ruminis]|uniref:DUF4309 domain-containing protein n=1 Tax=Desulforamulus ruminis TaxID=1564 RepID=UPI002FDA1FA1
MIKKLLPILLLIIIISGYKLINLQQEQVLKEIEEGKNTIPKETILQQESEKAQDNSSFLNIKQVRVKGIDFSVGLDCNEILAKLGNPKDEGVFEGSYYLAYDQIIFFLDSIEKQGNVNSFAVWEGIEIDRVKVGMTPSDIKNILGDPFKEGTDTNTNYYLFYKTEDLSVTFFSDDENSPTTSALIKKE